MATRLYYCPKCNPERDSTQLDTGCLHCGGVGHLEAEADAGLIPYAASKRPVWTWGRGAYIASIPDPLVELARCRRDGARWRSVAYANARRIAMKLVDLPIDDGHLLVSPETAAYFNALNHREAA